MQKYFESALQGTVLLVSELLSLWLRKLAEKLYHIDQVPGQLQDAETLGDYEILYL